VVDAARERDRLRTDLVHLWVALEPFAGIAAGRDYDRERRSEIEREIRSKADSLRRGLER